MEVAEGVHRLSKRGVVNFYLIREQDKVTLVDAGTPRDWDVLVGTLARIGLTPDALDAVLLTHAHSDHTGFAERARTQANAKVWVHGADAAAAKTGRTAKNEGTLYRHLLHPEAYRTVVSLVRRGAGKIVPIHVVSAFADGEAIDVPGRPRVVHAPGHTRGSCVVLLEDRRIALTGDVVVTRNPMTGRQGPQIMPAALNRDSQQALGSLGVIEKLPADLLLPGHGEPWTDGAAEAARRARAAGTS